jgi:hypothetical protein
MLRRALAALAREAILDERLAGVLAEIIDAAVADLARLTIAAQEAAKTSSGNQDRLRKQITKAERMMRRAPAGRARELAEHHVAMLRAQLSEVAP